MDEILETTLLEFDKSTFLIDLVKHKTEELYVRVLQTVQQEKLPSVQKEIKINPSIINSILLINLDEVLNFVEVG